MSNDIQKADQIAFHFYTKLFYIVNDARATEGPKAQQKVDKWFNLETLDSDLFTKEAREPYRNISQASSTGPPLLQIQVVLSVPELANNQVLVCMSPDSSRVRIEPTPKFIVLETWTLECSPHRPGYDDHFSNSNMDIALPIIYKHGIVFFRSVYSMLRILPAWKFYKRLRRRTAGVNRYGNFSILLRARPSLDRGNDGHILDFNCPPSPQSPPLTTSTHTFPPISHILGIFTLSTTYLDNSTFQLDELESLLSSKFISLDREEFVPTLEKNRQRDSISGSSLPSSTSGPKSGFSRSPPMQIARATSTGGAVLGVDSISVAERFVLPPVIGTSASTGTSALIPPPRPFPTMSSGAANTGTNPSGLAISRLRRESMNSSSSSLISMRDNLIGTSSVSSSPSTGPLVIRKPSIFKTNTVSSASSPSLSIRQGVPSSLSREGVVPSGISAGTGGTHSRQSSHNSPITNVARLPPSPIGTGFSGTHTGTPSSLGDRRPDTSGSGTDHVRDRPIGVNSIGFGQTMTEEGESHQVGPMPMPQRKRYSSSFGHRYTESAGSSAGMGMVVGSPASGGAVLPALGADRSSQSPSSNRISAAPSGRDTPASVFEGKKEDPTLYFGPTTDHDEISVFVQDIDSRKPLSGRTRELEKFDNVLGDPSRRSKQGQDHDRETTETNVKSKLRETTTATPHAFRPHRLVDRHSAFPMERAASLPSEAQPTTFAEQGVASSTSPPRGLILTSQGEVDERLTKMKEAFLRSIEGLGGGNGTRRKEKEKKNSPTTAGTPSTLTPFEQTSIDSRSPGPTPDQDHGSLASRGMNLGFPSRDQALETGPYGYTLSGLGRGRGRYASTSSSMLGSEVGTSQGSEEVIGRLDLYDERRRTGYQG